MFPGRMFPERMFAERMFPKVGAVAAEVARTGGGWAQPAYVRKPVKSKQDPLLEELRSLVQETEQKAPEKAPEIKAEVQRIEARREFVQSTPDYATRVKALNELNLEIARFKIELEKALKAYRDEEDEEDLIILLASL